jgi:hypothetical protein
MAGRVDQEAEVIASGCGSRQRGLTMDIQGGSRETCIVAWCGSRRAGFRHGSVARCRCANGVICPARWLTGGGVPTADSPGVS